MNEAKEADDKDPVIKDPDIKDSVIKDPDIKDPVIKDPDIKDHVIKGPDIKDPVIKKPDIKVTEVKERELLDLEINVHDIEYPKTTAYEIQNPEITDPEIKDQGISKPSVSNPAITCSMISNPTDSNSTISSSMISNPTNSNLTTSSPMVSNPTYSNLTISDAMISNPTIGNPIIIVTEIKDPIDHRSTVPMIHNPDFAGSDMKVSLTRADYETKGARPKVRAQRKIRTSTRVRCAVPPATCASDSALMSQGDPSSVQKDNTGSPQTVGHAGMSNPAAKSGGGGGKRSKSPETRPGPSTARSNVQLPKPTPEFLKKEAELQRASSPDNTTPQQQQHNNNNSSNRNADAPKDNKDKSCCFCWCCCCSCSCLSVHNRMNDRKMHQMAAQGENFFNEPEAQPTVEDIRSWGESFDRLMRCAAGRRVFRDFLRCEYSEENILFWLACEDLKRETNPELVEEKARSIYEDYVSILSPKEVSLDSKVREIVNKNMVAPTQNTFDEAQLQIYTLMHRDSYPRFVASTHYRRMAQLTPPTPPTRKTSISVG